MQRVRALVHLVAPVLLAVGLSGCGDQTDPDDPADTGSASAGASLTPQALAWVVAERLGTPDSARATSELDDAGPGTVAAELVYAGDGLAVAVSPEPPTGYLDCTSPDQFFDECADLGDGVTLAWQEEEPEEDPGVIYLFATKDDATVVLEQSSTPVTGDPREIDLPFSVDEMTAVARDPRVDLTTTEQAVDEGAQVPWWRGPARAPGGGTETSGADG